MGLIFFSSKNLRRIASGLVTLLVLSLAFATVFSTTVEDTFALHSECSDGKDNDNDGKVDYPPDDDCESLDDDFEGKGLSGNFITVTDDREIVAPGGNLVYIITLKQQRVNLRTVNVDLHLPFQSNAVSASDGGSVSSSHVHWTGITVHRNITRTLQVHANVRSDAAPGQYMVARAIADGAEDTDTTLIEGFVAQPLDVFGVSVTDGKEFAQPGEELTYTINVRNTSSRSARTDVRLGIPYDTYYLSHSPGGTRDSYTITWPAVVLAPKEVLTFRASVRVDPMLRTQRAIRARASAGTQSATDRTLVKVGLPLGAISARITDNRETVEIGETLMYRIRVINDSNVIGSNVAVDAGLPLYAEFVSATEGGVFDGTNVRWIVTQVAPRGERMLSFSVRVRSDAPIGHVLSASAVSDGITGLTARDFTTVVSRSSRARKGTENVLFRKTSDRAEVVPGGKVRFTLTVRNTLDSALTDAIIIDRYNGTYLSLQSVEQRSDLLSETDGSMRWRVPVLQPGEVWETSYILSVEKKVPAGTDLGNIATIRGTGIDELSLTERVHTIRAAVMRGGIPKAGAPMDAVLGFLTMVMAGAAMILQKRLTSGLM